jgi:hypothetical protein
MVSGEVVRLRLALVAGVTPTFEEKPQRNTHDLQAWRQTTKIDR